MAEKKLLEIKYRCQHPSCQIKSCREGVIEIGEDLFDQLNASYGDKALFKSPRGICRMGFPQPFQIISISGEAGISGEQREDQGFAEGTEKSGPDPIEILMKEHQVVLNKLELIEDQIRKRDADGLWITTAEVENEIMLHSIEKEEFVLFPLIENASPLSASEIAIIKEDHRELIALLHSFRDGLKEGDILDGVAHSMIANLKSHIQKEDYEFFNSVNGYLDAEGKRRLLEGMAKADEFHIPIEAGDRFKERHGEDETASLERERFKEALTAAKKASKDDDCCH